MVYDVLPKLMQFMLAASSSSWTTGIEECSICGLSEGPGVHLEAGVLADLDFVNRRVVLSAERPCCETCKKAADLSLLLNYSFQAGKAPGAR